MPSEKTQNIRSAGLFVLAGALSPFYATALALCLIGANQQVSFDSNLWVYLRVASICLFIGHIILNFLWWWHTKKLVV